MVHQGLPYVWTYTTDQYFPHDSLKPVLNWPRWTEIAAVYDLYPEAVVTDVHLMMGATTPETWKVTLQ